MLPPSFRKVDPSSLADPLLRAAHRPRCRCRSSTSTPRRSWRSGSRPWTAWRRCRCTARRSTRCGSSSTRSSSRPGASASTRWRPRSQNGNVNLPTGILWGTDKAYSVESQGQLTNAAGFGALVVAYRDGAPVRLRRPRPGDRQRAGHQAGELVQRPARRSCSPSSASRAPTRWRWRERVKAEVERLRPQLPAVGRASPRSTTARRRSRPRWRT